MVFYPLLQYPKYWVLLRLIIDDDTMFEGVCWQFTPKDDTILGCCYCTLIGGTIVFQSLQMSTHYVSTTEKHFLDRGHIGYWHSPCSSFISSLPCGCSTIEWDVTIGEKILLEGYLNYH